MNYHTVPRFRALASGAAVAMSIFALPVFGADATRSSHDPCATAGTGSATVIDPDTGSQRSSVTTRTDRTKTKRANRDASASMDCRVVPCGPSSAVTVGPGGELSGSTSMPGGSSVTVQSRNGVSSSSTATASGSSRSSAAASSSTGSTATAGSSTGSGASSAAAGTGREGDCAIVDPGANDPDPKLNQKKR